MPTLALQDVQGMRDTVFFDGPEAGRRMSRFWMLLVLSSMIAAAGVVADSTATVIGAMIVAPLLVPIQGTMLATVLGDRANLLRSLGLVVAGAAAAIAIGFVVGLIVVHPVTAANNSQVASRVAPTLIDLFAALATGAVGSVALVRRDISDTLPGVAIAISLVPPLSVVGLTLKAQVWEQAGGALLLFVTNVAAILATGTVIMAIYGAQRLGATEEPARRVVHRRGAFVTIGALVALVAAPLAVSSIRAYRETTEKIDVREVGTAWATDHEGWDLVSVDNEQGKTVAKLEGPLPLPDTRTLRQALLERGVDIENVQVELLPRQTIDFGD